MSDLTKIGMSMINTDDLCNYLDIAGRFVTQEQLENTPNTKFSKIGNVDSELVAQCENASDHTSVRNASNLGNYPAEYYLNVKQGETLNNKAVNINNTFDKEVSDLRDEIYQLREELAKAGLVTGYSPYEGFYDMFKAAQPLHENTVITQVVGTSSNSYEMIVEDTAFDKFFIGERIFIKSLVTGDIATVRIVDKLNDGQTIVLNTSPSFELGKGKAQVYKSKGNIINGTFTFGEINPERPGSKEYYSCLDDDTFRVRRKITESETGFGYTFRIPAVRQKNYLSKIDIQVRKYGNPGDLICYVIDEEDIPRWRNGAQASSDNDKTNNKYYETTKYKFFAKSQPLNVDSAMGEHLANFSFYDASVGELQRVAAEDLTAAEIASMTDEERESLRLNGYTMRLNQSSYPLMTDIDTTDHKVRYCMIIEALSADSDNYYEILFLQHRNNEGNFEDLQLNNITYNYTAVDSDSEENALITNTSINAADMYYGITMVEAVHKSFTPYNDGAYSAIFNVDTPIELSKARLTMRIQREGIFKLDSYNTIIPKTGDMPDMSIIRVSGVENGFSNASTVTIGTNIRQLENVDNRSLTVKKGFHTDGADIIYPIGYKVYINALLKEWDEEKCVTVIKDRARYELPISHIMHDLYRKANNISDRIVFENAFEETDENDKIISKKYNCFEIQIEWNKSASVLNESNVGQIYDLVLSLTRSSQMS